MVNILIYIVCSINICQYINKIFVSHEKIAFHLYTKKLKKKLLFGQINIYDL